MKYPAHAYGKALLDLLEEYPERESEIIKGFWKTISASGDVAHAEKIFSSMKTMIARREGKAEIKVYSARPLSESNKKSIEDAFGGKARIESVVLPEIIAGIKMIVNGTVVVDATLKTKLRSLVR